MALVRGRRGTVHLCRADVSYHLSIAGSARTDLFQGPRLGPQPALPQYIYVGGLVIRIQTFKSALIFHTLLGPVWNVLSDIVTNVASSSETQVQDWLTATNNAEGQDLGKLMDDNVFLSSNGLDQSNQLALNFEDLFQGCLV